MSSGVKRYDFYRKAMDGLQTKSSVGGVSSCCFSVLMVSIDYWWIYHSHSCVFADFFLPFCQDLYNSYSSSSNG